MSIEIAKKSDKDNTLTEPLLTQEVTNKKGVKINPNTEMINLSIKIQEVIDN